MIVKRHRPQHILYTVAKCLLSQMFAYLNMYFYHICVVRDCTCQLFIKGIYDDKVRDEVECIHCTNNLTTKKWDLLEVLHCC